MGDSMDIPEGWTTGTVQANGISLRYYRTGEGPPLVMAHGFYDSGRCFAPLAAYLADAYDVVMYDARGHGKSDAPDTGYDMDSRVADLAGLIHSLGLVDPILFGHSMGGSTVAWTAANHPALPQAVILEEPVGIDGSPDIGPDERAAIVRERIEDRSIAALEADIKARFEDPDPDWVRRCARASMECSPHIAAIAREGYPDLREAFAKITCPTLLLKADADAERREQQLEIAAGLADGQLVHIPDADHYVFQTQFDTAFAELDAFLSSL